MREYEFTFISKPDLPESERNKHFSKYEDLLLKGGGQILRKDDWGVKKLAYPIKKHFRGHYVLYDFIGAQDQLAEAERLMRIDDNVLRFMSIKVGEEPENIEKRKEEVMKQVRNSEPRKERR